ncbi:NADPH-dependent 2,4-dienoyl-CoA reductase/sulfur reductase-like enzyme [Clostridium saccharoperbutylacetonicum]|uniref:Coenzyme A disulfide reductase Cdr n=1 Tax=Clostridium saccharoperbutylacetonicum N1-4(HMT) TaxID=931276 RepID=M1MFD2_9CLOT|nr:FAD-dependent oxidoreductase [Clostridium saccharoperbutylacetonicum]AGF56624.1 coenzyme A disulfide reductase Cdr [Clostridium saccharoperbutylacetonicum N1-4(HMT)]NRT62625.1 NADPH-dependent 2,4-dienoyl-CoA reductase/sulfur reductase-like enzyme [Clostridium saccharoperbutylacetonicum]NSB25972.1 NADPH-dependent 2,4-dienoyl-CoA reductase/sulfur reductase-like enzyme/rhodanese-related sulfurtransferase [Clostridium saccharoperbutylacetonicum]NSB45330.1 NADPH-dependent 2,4-dienoyl-CoA reductas
MKRKILIVGGVAGGASAAARLRRLSEEDEIVMFEKGPHVSFSNCSLPYHLSGLIDEADKMVLMSPEKFLVQYNIQAKVNNEVLSINKEEKYVVVKNLVSGESYKENYDKLILSPGAKPIVPNILGIEEANIFTIRNVVDIDKLNKYIKSIDVKDIAVIGGGFIGVEAAENLREAGYNVALIEGTDQILRPFDYDMVQILHKEIYDHGINLIVEDKVERFEKDTVILASGKKISSKVVVMAIGVSPETTLAKEAAIDIGETGAIKVDQNYRTADKDIYAVGDAIEVYNALTHTVAKLFLAGPALKQARAVADHINGKKALNKGYIGSSAIKVFDYNGASTGLNEALINVLNMKIKYEVVRVILSDKVGIMPSSAPMHFKLLFEVPTGKILGAQAIGKGDVTKRIDVVATAIKFGGTIEDLKDLELCYAPPFSTAKDVVNYAGYVGSNLLNGDFKQVNVDLVRGLVEHNAYIIDVRERGEYANGHIKNAVNIPLSELRQRVNEIPKEKPVYLHCRTGQRSYNATLALQNLGYNNVYNITGSFLGLSFYEYFNDKTKNRESILTEYNFR